MSRSNWLYYLALGLFLMLTFPALGQVGNDKDLDGANQKPQATDQQSIKSTTPPPLTKRSGPIRFEGECDNPQSPEKVEFCHQIRMADDPEYADRWARRQFLATLGEIVALVVAIGVAIVAVAAAFKAVGERWG